MTEPEMNSADVSSQNVSHETMATAAPAEKTLTQSEVDRIVGENKKRAYESGRQAALQEAQKAQAAQQPAQNAGNNSTTYDVSEVRKVAREELQNFQQEMSLQHQANQIVDSFRNKISMAATDKPELQEGIKDLNLENNTHLVWLTNAVDNTADVVAELLNKPSHIATINELYRVNPALAQRQIKQLSDSIKTNQRGLESPVAKEPLGQISNSPVGAGGGDHSLDDFKKLFRV